MTREQAKHRLLWIQRCTPIHTRDDVKDIKALEIAIQALSKEQKIKAIVVEWQSDTWTDNFSYECMRKIADIVSESEDKE